LPYKRGNERVSVDVWFGFANQPLFKVFAGYLNKFSFGGLPGSITLTAGDKGRQARREVRTVTRANSSVAVLMRTLAEDNGLEIDFTDASESLDEVRYEQMIQHNESDWDLLERLAEQTGHSAFIRGNTVFIRQVGDTRSAEPIIVEVGTNVSNGFKFSVPELTRSTTPNIYDQENPLFEGSDFDEHAIDRPAHIDPLGLNIQATLAPSFDAQALERTKQAQARARKIFTATFPMTTAFPEADVDDQIIARGFGRRFDGVWNVEGITHDLVRSTTVFNCFNGGSNI
jgi:phage protein D